MPLRVFFYMPFEHSEDPADQIRSVALMSAAGDEDYTRYARLHAGIIKRFGRFPHRNEVLGRFDTPEEIAFLAEGGFKGQVLIYGVKLPAVPRSRKPLARTSFFSHRSRTAPHRQVFSIGTC